MPIPRGTPNPVDAASPPTDAEYARLAALARYAGLDGLPQAAFERLTRLAARSFGAPIALISLADDEQQWFKACLGLQVGALDRSTSLCAHTLASGELTVVPDLAADPQYRGHPMVVGAPHLRFYAGAPLSSAEGFTLGTLCVMDTQPHAPLTGADRTTLSDLAALVVDELELRLSSLNLARAVQGAEARTRTLSQALAHSETLYAVSSLGDLELSASELFLRATELLAQAVPVDWAGLVAVSGERAFPFSVWHSPAAAGFARDMEAGMRRDRTPQLWEILRAEGPVFRDGASGAAPSDHTVAAAVGAALGKQGASAYVLSLLRLEGGAPWSATDRQLIETVVRELRRALGRQQGLDALRSSEQQLSLATQSAPLILWATDLDGRFTLSRGQGLTALGLAQDRVVGQSVFEVYAGQPQIMENVQRALAGETLEGTVEVAGRVFQARYAPRVDDAGQLCGALGVGYDVTELQAAERAAVQARRQAEALLQLSAVLQSRRSVDEVAGAALAALQGVMALGWLALWRRDGDLMRRLAHAGAAPARLEAIQAGGLPVERYAEQGVLAGQASFLYGESLPQIARDDGLSGVALVPVALDDPQRAMILGAYRTQDAGPWRADEVDLLLAAARTLEVGVGRQRQVEQLEVAAHLDTLTGLGNRRAFTADLAAELARAERHGHALGVLTLDLDGLKAINDQYGHARGDALLRHFALQLRAALRVGDRLYRLGGDEYAALLPHAGPGQLAAFRARVDAALERTRAAGYPEAGASAGLACYPDDAAQPAELLRLSDARMYAEKAAKPAAR